MQRFKSFLRLPYLPILIAPLILFSPLLLTGSALYWGTPYLQFAPWRVLAWNIVRSGAWPLWNPLVGMGAPLLANYQLAFFYPATWFLLGLQAIGGAFLMAWGQTIVVIAHIIWAGLGMVYLCRRLGLSRLAQTVGGLAFSLSGYLVARAGFLSINAAVAWLPWIMLAGLMMISVTAQGPSKEKWIAFLQASFPLTLCLTLQLLSGHAQTTYYTILLLAAWLAFWGYRLGKARGVLNAAFSLAFVLLFSILISSIQLVPTAEYLLQSQRSSSVSYSLAVNYSFFPLRFLTLIVPNLFGNPAHGNYLLHADNYWEDAIYIGFIPFVIAIVWTVRSIIFSKKKQASAFGFRLASFKSLSIFLVIVIVCSFILALGKNLPVFPFLYKYIPTFNLFQAPTRFTLLVEFGLSLLAAMGIDAWQRPEGKSRAWTRRGIAVSIAVLAGAAAGLVIMAGQQVTMIQAIALAGLWGLCAGILTLYLPGDEARKMKWSWIVVAVITLDLLLTGWGLNPGIDPAAYQPSLTGINEVGHLQDGQRIYLDPSSENTLKFEQFFQFNDFTQPVEGDKLAAAMLPDSNILAGIPSANNFDPMVPARYAQWMEYLGSQADSETQSLMLSLMNVGLVESVDSDSATGISFHPVNSQPLVWSTCAMAAANGDEAWNKTLSLKNSSAIPYAAIVIEGLPPDNVECPPPSTATSQAASDSAGNMAISIETRANGWLMIPTTWYPGWKAMMDGKEIPIYRADYLFMAVNVTEGTHKISLVYQPDSFKLGSFLSVAGLLLISLAYIFIKR